MNTFAHIRQYWQQQLSALYPSDEAGQPSREIDALFRFVLEDLLDLSPADQLAQRDMAQPEAVCTVVQQALGRLLTGEPLQHVTGFTYFDDLKIRVSPAVLIPRPETEELVHWIAESLPAQFAGTMTDWCTGSGCIALALKNRFPQSVVNGFDWSEEALEVAETNARALELNVVFERKDALAPTTGKETTDLIVSNPPYIPEKEKAAIRTNVSDFEPYMALFVPDGEPLLFYEALTEIAVAALKPGGMLFFELHEDYAQQTKAMVAATGVFSAVEIRNDIYGKQRMLKAVKVAG